MYSCIVVICIIGFLTGITAKKNLLPKNPQIKIAPIDIHKCLYLSLLLGVFHASEVNKNIEFTGESSVF